MSDHEDKLRAQRNRLEHLLVDRPCPNPKCLSTDVSWTVVIQKHPEPGRPVSKTLEVLCPNCDYDMSQAGMSSSSMIETCWLRCATSLACHSGSCLFSNAG